MTSIGLTSISELRTELLHRLGEDEFKLRAISTRVLLRTGVSLVSPDSAHETDPETLRKVLAVLDDMGQLVR